MEQSRVRSAKLQLILSMFIYGSIGIFVKHIPLPSSIIANVRGIVGTLFLLTVLLVKHQTLNWQAIHRNLKFLIPCGILLGFNWIALFEAYRYTTVAIATVCYYLAPVFVLLVAPLLLKERLTVNRCVCAAVALLGMIFTSYGIINENSRKHKGASGTSKINMNSEIVHLGRKALLFSVTFTLNLLSLVYRVIIARLSRFVNRFDKKN